jgi:pectate lyase
MASAGATLTADCPLVVLDLQTENKPRIPEEVQVTSIYPNPAKGKVTIAVALKKNEEAVIRIYDAQGRLMDNVRTITAATTGTQKIQYNLNRNQPGIYNVIVTTSKGVSSTYILMVQ